MKSHYFPLVLQRHQGHLGFAVNHGNTVSLELVAFGHVVGIYLKDREDLNILSQAGSPAYLSQIIVVGPIPVPQCEC